MFCASVAYLIEDGATFDLDYYLQQHVPMFVEALGDNCVRYEVRKGLQVPGAPAPTYMYIANFYVRSGEAFGATLAQHGKRIYGDIPNFTNVQPVRAWAEVVASAE